MCSVGGQYCNIKENSSTLSANKRNIGAAADRVLADEPDSGKRESYKALMLAVAMQVSFPDSLTLLMSHAIIDP